jgi:predicted RNase H-like HicB family nuclease
LIIQLPVSVREEGDIFVVHCPVFHIMSKGKTMEDALNNIKNELESYLDDEKVQKEYHNIIHDYGIRDFEIVDVVVNEKSEIPNK